MKICHIIFSLATGGAETMLVDIVNEQVKTEEVTLLIINNIINKQLLKKIDANIQIIRINRIPSGKNPIPVLKINYYIFRLHPDVIHFHNVNGIGLLFPFHRKRTILTIHDTQIISSSFRKYNKLSTISNAVEQDILKRYGLNSTVIHNGIKTKNIKIKEKMISGNTFRIVQVSRLSHLKKGQHLLIESISRLVYNLGITNIQVDFIGEGSSLDYLKQLTEDYRVKDFVNFLGLKNRDYVYNNLCNYDLLVQPSINEGFGLTVAEGMAARVPVLVSDIEGPMEVIQSGKYGFSFQSQNVDSLTETLLHIINTSLEDIDQLLVDAYFYTLENFSIEKTANNYLCYYKEMVKN